MKLECFLNSNLFSATKNLFEQLKIPLNCNTEQALKPKDILKDKFKDRNPFTNIKEDGLFFAGLIDDSVFNSTDKLTYEKAIDVADKKYEGLMLFAIELSKKPNRSEIAELTRAFNQISKKMPVGLVFKYDNEISIALSERFKYLQNLRDGEKIGKVIILRDIDIEDTHAGHLRILEDLAKHEAKKFDDLHKKWLDVLKIKTLNDAFYERLVKWYKLCFEDIKIDLKDASKILGKKIDDELKPQAVIRVIIRLMFIWFMKEKGLIKNDFFSREFADEFLKNKDTYYNAILQNLFFAVLNKKIDERRFRKHDKNNYYDPDKNDYGILDIFRFEDDFKPKKADEFLQLANTIPFVNGGLFTCHDYVFSGKDSVTNENNSKSNYLIDGFSERKNCRARISDNVIFELICLFNDFVFTIEESTPQEQDIALDPELLGIIFENLIGFYNPETKETARKQTGSFYTPREIVDYMCCESLKNYLKTKFPSLHSQIDKLIDSNEDYFDFPEKNNMLAAITDLKILDPACGSGAFPMGMFNLMVRTIEKLQERKTTYKNKLDIIKKCIYGVDIQNIAIEISKLRFFISLLVDCPKPKNIEDFDVLPNLETKFVVANALIGINLKDSNYKGVFENHLRGEFKKLTEIFLPFTTAKTPEEKERIKNDFNNKKEQIINNTSKFDIDMKKEIQAWNPFNVCYCSSFFDSGIMFGLPDGFDIVIGNPPYVNVEKIDKNIKDNIHKFRTAYQKYDLYVLFYEKAIDLLKNNGFLSFITSNKFLSQGYGLLLRKEFLKNHINSIINFNYDVFDAATVRTCIFIMQKQNQANEKIKIIDINSEKSKDKFVKLKYNLLNQNIFNETDENNFRINLTNEKLKILYKIKSNTTRIDDIFSVNYGLRACNEKLGLKKAAFIYKENLSGKYKNYYEGKDTGKWLIENSAFIDYTPELLYNAQFPELFETKKLSGLVTLSDIEKLRFIYDNEGFYCNHSVVVLTLWHLFKDINNQTIKRNITKYKIETSMRFSYAFVQGILNSKMIKFYVNELLYDGTHFYPNHIKSLPIKNISLSQQQPIIDLVNQILYLKNRGNQPISDIVSNDIIASYFEKVIDACVYELYFEDEIKTQQVDVLGLIQKQLDSASSLPIEQQISRLFEEWNDYKNEVRNRIILQETRSESVALIIKGMNYEKD